MSKDPEKPHPAKGNAAAAGNPTGRGNCPVIVVGIGVSERGLNSVKQIFTGMPSGHGVAFVLIQHLGPSQENLAVKELSDRTALTVVEATDGMEVLADRIHVMPANKFLNISGSILSLHEPVQCNGVWMPIDHFFCALAADQGRRGCGILLSGTGSDGTLGLSEIKATGGRTIVEEPGSAEFAAITQKAINAGLVDAVVPIEAVAEAVVALAEQVIADTRNLPAESPEFDANLKDILEILRAKVGHDFRCYKPNTIVRRIHRRMTLAKSATFAAYVDFLREHPEEVRLLQKDLLIGVTDFFRQPQAWDILEKKVIADILGKAVPGAEIRVWVPGSSTGQEVYSLAILLAEEVEKTSKRVTVQIFATDSDVASLGIARSGAYSAEELGKNVSRERLERFFVRKDDRYQIIKKLRDQIVFAPQNLSSDPPFSKLDIVSCRNLLMYFEQPVQEKVIALFHFSLREGGYLFLGTAETVGDREDLFEPVSKKWRIYRRIGVGRPVGVDIPVRPPGEPYSSAAGKLPIPATHSRLSLTSTAHQILLDRFTPACVMVDRKLHVLYVHGAVENYLTFPPGELTTRVVDMAREGLRARLRGALNKSLEVNKPVSITARVKRGSRGLAAGGERSVAVKATVSPLRYPREIDGLLLITFEDYRLPVAGAHRKGTGKSDLQELEAELKVTREELQSTIEQLEDSNDQLKAYNEEVTAANEELQSANEELETSKEELQSLNEELNTINTRLQEKVEELGSANNDMVNLLSSTSIATVFLDKQLKVRRYTPASTRLLSLIPSDLGRPVGDILRRFSDEALLEHAAGVLASLTPITREVQAEDGRWYIRGITPYRTQDDRIEGVVITFVDVCELKESEEALREAKEHLETRVKERTAELEQANRALQAEIAERQKAEQELRHHKEHLEDLVKERTSELENRNAQLAGEIAERKLAEEALRRSKEEWERTFDSVPDLIAILDDRHRVVRANRAMAERLGHTPDECVGLPCYAAVHGTDVPPAFCPHTMTLTDFREHTAEVHEDRLGGHFLVSTTPILDEQGKMRGSVHVARDITARKKAEEDLRESEQRVRLKLESILSPEGDIGNLDLSDIIDSRAIQSLIDDFYKLARVPMSILDLKGKVLVGAGWQDICTKFHRAHPDTCRHCVESDTQLSSGLLPGESKMYKCKNNMWDIATPIVVGGRRVGNVFSGQFFLEDEPLDYELFRAQARQYGFDEEKYIAALEAVPRLSRDSVNTGMAFLMKLADIISKLGYSNIKLARSLAERDTLMHSLRESGEDLNFAQAVAHTGSWRLDLRGNELHWSDETHRIFGIPKGTPLTYEAFLAAIHPHDREYVDRKWTAALKGEPYDIEHRIVVGDTVKWVRERAELEFDNEGSMVGGFGTVQDITERKKAEEALRKAHDELEMRVRERTAELERRNKELQEFVFVASHDLREPLRKIQTFGDLVVTKSSEGLTDAGRDYINRMQGAAARMQMLLESLLRYSRVTSHTEPFQETDMNKSVEEALSNLEAAAEEKKARLEVGQLPTVEADRVQIVQLFQNLISNALKFQSPNNTPNVKIYAKAIENRFGEKNAYEICVEDNGIGFEEQYLDKIFKPFQRLHGREEYEGVGIGLAICRKIVEHHGGSLTARSTSGKGATFIITLPRKQSK